MSLFVWQCIDSKESTMQVHVWCFKLKWGNVVSEVMLWVVRKMPHASGGVACASESNFSIVIYMTFMCVM